MQIERRHANLPEISLALHNPDIQRQYRLVARSNFQKERVECA
jgi:hypothetical protein